MYQALYRKWRPAVFDDVYGQKHITSILRSEVESGKVSHAYLFCGPRGTGKTTCAKIIAKAVNCENPKNGNPCGVCAACRSIDGGLATDVIEMDAASNNGVDSIRELRDGVVYTPAELKYRVYIIDEVHMLSISAFNALLKTLEEPPRYVIFVLATTELHKIPATVLSRCQRFDFRRVTSEALVERMKVVCAGERIDAEEGALSLIARLSQGSFRDALNMLEFCSGDGKKLTEESAGALLGSSSERTLAALSSAIADGDVETALDTVNEIYLSSRDVAIFWRELVSFLRDVLVAAVTRGKANQSEEISNVSEQFAPSRLVEIIETFTYAETDMTRTPSSAKLYAELAIIKAASPSVRSDESAISERLAALENKINLISSGNANNVYRENASTAAKTEKVNEIYPEKSASREEKSASAAAFEKKKRGDSSGFSPLRKWADIVRRVSQTDPSISPSLFRAKALEGGDGRLYIFFDNPFSVTVINKSEKSKENISNAVFDVLGKRFSAESVTAYLEKNAEEIIHEPIDDIIAKIKETEGEEQ